MSCNRCSAAEASAVSDPRDGLVDFDYVNNDIPTSPTPSCRAFWREPFAHVAPPRHGHAKPSKIRLASRARQTRPSILVARGRGGDGVAGGIIVAIHATPIMRATWLLVPGPWVD